MGTKIKGIYRSFKYITQIFVVKKPEMDIGCPTNVKHVAHIGCSAPSWMNEFRTGQDFAATNIGSACSSWSSQDFGRSQKANEIYNDLPPDVSNVQKKQRCKKTKLTSSRKSSSSSAAKSKAKFSEIKHCQIDYRDCIKIPKNTKKLI